MASLRFTKGHGTQNDFVLLFDEHGEIEITPDLVRFLCNRRAGIGADGVIRAVRAGRLEAGKGYDASTWFMDYWNADGTVSEMCGNGARVFALFLEREAGVDARGGLTIGTRGGTRTVTALGNGRYAVGMGQWSLGDAADGFDSEVHASGLTPPRPALSVNVGNPHHVVALATPDELEALDLTTPPTVLPQLEHGSNVEFAVTLGGEMVGDEPHGRVRMRVHERGSGETMSCGTGACAVALAVRSWAGAGAPSVWDVEVPGGMVTVRIKEDSTILEGPAVLVADGALEVNRSL
ncbi:diaminopimelate epimerase [Demequina sp. TTPB684]|uniref:diaminopimelate epimerase n=1 Tax=unclassified Demequina TaxID=2620311 RepID=UPI001CF2E64C|nr:MULTISPECIES: diaminopimelate epimerase [unclassified Demequina]MCB2413737.1 diaminopimelate epimerase [Demequina sp. TTPB684]UPU89592.1 diaminopimelate epimerase [Demequina sp. TMPB413]